jgi:hypothetical protein
MGRTKALALLVGWSGSSTRQTAGKASCFHGSVYQEEHEGNENGRTISPEDISMQVCASARRSVAKREVVNDALTTRRGGPSGASGRCNNTTNIEIRVWTRESSPRKQVLRVCSC